MEQDKLDQEELVRLVKAVFPVIPLGGALVILIDTPDSQVPDNPKWRDRRAIALNWTTLLKNAIGELGVERVMLAAYENAESNNADLPSDAFIWEHDTPPETVNDLWKKGMKISFEKLFATTRIVLAPTELSATAPLKLASACHGFRAATMPGFSKDMVAALRIDYEEVNRRVEMLKLKLDPAVRADVLFLVDDKKECALSVDLRHRTSQASGGCFPNDGEAGNLPSGETYIVPYEGEVGEISETAGILPVQHGKDLVYYTVETNRAVSVEGEGQKAKDEAKYLARTPAYGNMAELGFGVLGDFGLEPIGEILLDEKLGFHIAFGRSDHFGGAVGPADFPSPKEVVHIDRIYIPSTQPRIVLKKVELISRNGDKELLIKDGSYTCFDR